MNHRGGDIGHYNFRKINNRSAELVCNNPYPCDFDRGIIVAKANKFKPNGSMVFVEHDDSQGCRKEMGESCIYLVKW